MASIPSLSAPPPLGETAIIVGIEAAALLAAWGGRRFLATKEGRLAEDLPWMLEAFAAALLVGALYLDVTGWLATGLEPTANGMGATVFMLSVLQGQVVVVAVIMATYLAFREARGIMTTPTNVTMDIVARFIMFARCRACLYSLAEGVPGVQAKNSEIGEPIDRPSIYRTLLIAFVIWSAHFAFSYAGVLVFPDDGIARIIAIGWSHRNRRIAGSPEATGSTLAARSRCPRSGRGGGNLRHLPAIVG